MDLNRLGTPDIEIAALRIWVHGRQFEDAQDYWDGNWLRVTAHRAAEGASVRLHGSVLHLSEVTHLLDGCQDIERTLSGTAELQCLEPNLHVTLAVTSPRGSLNAEVQITPDHLTQEHTFRFGLDQTYLPGIIGGIRKVLGEYPVRGTPPEDAP